MILKGLVAIEDAYSCGGEESNYRDVDNLQVHL